ncbi:MAG: hypothetical protein JJT81_16640 [Rubellimicrobium sp.]|nr:hypothetical protein [Rubellimicrobium sp.]
MSDLLKRRDYTFTVQALSPVHVGGGFCREDLLPEVEQDGQPGKVQVAAIQRDNEGRPWIPGTTIKGALVRLARAMGLSEADVLFGAVKADDTGQMGAMLVRGAPMVKPGATDGLPHARDGVFVASRTSIDAGRGTAASNRLFHSEAVAAGATFEMRLRLETRGDIVALDAALLKLLGGFGAPEGVALGADQTSGQGRLRLVGDVRMTNWKANSGGGLQADKTTQCVPPSPQPCSAAVTLTLVCPGPYLSRDPAWTTEARRAAEAAGGGANRTQPHLRALRLDHVPYLTGQMVSGAMRARMAWLQAVEDVAAGRTVPTPVGVLKSAAAAAVLQPQERLFGVAGFRGVLTVSVGTISRMGKSAMTSTRIDRFAGGTIDNALFATDADYGVRLDLGLGLDARATDADRKALDRLVDDIRTNGLMLGHGTSRGFGWFRIEG